MNDIEFGVSKGQRGAGRDSCVRNTRIKLLQGLAIPKAGASDVVRPRILLLQHIGLRAFLSRDTEVEDLATRAGCKFPYEEPIYVQASTRGDPASCRKAAGIPVVNPVVQGVIPWLIYAGQSLW
jgi:hypothetical protein